MNKKFPLVVLSLSILCLVAAVTSLMVGSKKSRVYNQMKNVKIVESLFDINNMKDDPFLLSGYVENDNRPLKEDMIAYAVYKDDLIIEQFTPELSVTIGTNRLPLLEGYSLADFNKNIKSENNTFKGIRNGSQITIYSIMDKKDGEPILKGYELYPGTPTQYISFLSSPFNTYMVYVRVFIGLAVVFFLFSIVLNIKK